MKKARKHKLNVRVDDSDRAILREGTTALRQLRGDPSITAIRNQADFVRLAIHRLGYEARGALREQQREDALNAHAE